MTKKFEILEHTADLRIRAFGGTKEELFKNAALGMAQVQKSSLFEPELKVKNEKLKIKIKIISPDLTALLIDFLSEVLTQSQINKAVFFEIKFAKFSDAELEAEIEGVKVEEFDEDIKAATYHGAEIVFKNGMYEVAVVYDI